MQQILVKSFWLIALCLALPTGCARPGPSEPHSIRAAGAERGALASWAAQQPVGSTAVLDDPNLGAELTVLIETSYRAASGLPCKRVRVTSAGRPGPGEPVAVCNDRDGWFLAPRIWGGASLRYSGS
jgi:hypothetical protein